MCSFAPIAVIAGSEVGVPSADWVGEALGLVANPSAMSLNRRDKFLMAQALQEAGVESIHTTKTKTLQESKQCLIVGIRILFLKPITRCG